MKYSQIRFALLTFVLGFVSVTFVDFVQTKWIELSIELPKAQSETLVLLPMTKEEIIKAGWGDGGSGDTDIVMCSRRKLAVKGAKKHLKFSYNPLNKSR